MKIIPNRTIFRCDHCTTHRLSKGAAERHEQFCKANPNNKHRCFGCQHLVVGPREASDDRSMKEFACAHFNQRLYSYVAEKRGIVGFAAEQGAIRMPLQCPAFVYQHDDNEPVW